MPFDIQFGRILACHLSQELNKLDWKKSLLNGDDELDDGRRNDDARDDDARYDDVVVNDVIVTADDGDATITVVALICTGTTLVKLRFSR